ncbi:beta-ketoacyl synthase N-terminal-like domain-containing protein [Streptomyces sp. NPDC020379]|uniref:beta-ketoacyl synthase N-terminal-like domain-containing protein n=1 Tax=Streptomyces sp. NPDC020379 TaxID=3365071 RepID=UPI0037B6D38E
MSFEPVAVVGRGLVLPGALNPQQFWANLLARRISLGPAPRDRWGFPRDGAAAPPTGHPSHRVTGVGGYVRGFDDVFDPSGYGLDRAEILRLDPLFQWTLYAGRQALDEAGHSAAVPPRAGLVIGNLSYPSTAAVRHAEHVWLSVQDTRVRDALLETVAPRPDALNRFSSGLPALLAARALGLHGGAYALDAACATSLYAVKLACDRLQDLSADLMLAGAVSCSDSQLIHRGFATMGVLSPTGRSRPFHREADGLVPAEGAVLFALMRLSDALSQDRPVLAVVRGIGLGNDGRAAGLIAPDAAGQERAMRAAYASAGVPPESVGLLECHATGTVVGDAVEAHATGRVFAAHPALPVGSVKANVGHLLTASGSAALLKAIGALGSGVRPATPHDGTPTVLEEHPLRLVTDHEDWTAPRRAAVSSFGFGGTNAHLVLDAWDTRAAPLLPVPAPAPPRRDTPVAVVALAARVGRNGGTDDLVAALCTGQPHKEARETAELALDGLHFPPLDLREALPQQLLALDVAREAARDVTLPAPHTAVVVGAGVDPQVARHMARRRIDEIWRRSGLPAPAGPPSGLRDAFASPGTPAGVVGAMMNIAANRINSQLNLTGPGFTVSAEEDSGTVALSLAARLLRTGEADAVLVAAADLAHDPVHRAALRDLGADPEPGDAAVALVLKRLPDAERAGEPPLALLDETDGGPPDLRVSTVPLDGEQDRCTVSALFGTPHAAAGLLAVAVAVASLRHGIRPWPGRCAGLDPRLRTAEIVVPVLRGPQRRVRLQAPPAPVLVRGRPQVAFVYTNGSASYPHMGRELALALPDLVESVRQRCDLEEAPLSPSGFAADGALDRIWSATRLAALHTAITRHVLGLRPDAAIGYSSGETSAMVALGVWPDAADLIEDARHSELFTHEVTGEFRAVRRAWQARGITGHRWRNYLVTGPLAHVREAVAREPAVHLMAVNAPGVCVIGGEETACVALVREHFPHQAVRIDYDIAAHAPDLETVRESWHRLHLRRTVPIPGLRLYRGDTAEPYLPTEENVADTITEEAMGTIDFTAVIERAYADGVRVFVEHGPGSQCTDWIGRILAGREHLAVALDTPGGRALDRLRRSVQRLTQAGLCDPAPLLRLLGPEDGDRAGREPDRTLRVPSHPPAVRLPVPDALVTMMGTAPAPPTAPSAFPADGRETAGPTTSPPDSPEPGNVHAAAVRYRNRVTALHRLYVTEQTALHQRYLRGQQLPTRFPARTAPPPPRAAPMPGAVPPADPPSPPPPALPGPKFGRAELERLAVGPVSELFGPLFTAQDGYRHQTRLPAPPLLLVDRVTGIDAAPGSMGRGTIWTETDLGPDSWFLDHTGRVPAGLLIEAGQADLLLISWLGIDLLNRGERVYRLLGCSATYHGSAPRMGQTLRYEIRIDGHAEHEGTRLFFFHSDCFVGDERIVSIRNGQAGFFTDTELAAARGIPWEPDATLCRGLPFEPVAPPADADRFDAEAVRAFAGGRPHDCFGPAWKATRAHVRTPRIDGGRLLLIDEVTAFEPAGGAFGRGYLRAETRLRPDGWYFDGHFKDDPVLPGTLMSHGAQQAMAFHLAALGLTIDRDGARFEPLPGLTGRFRCRGQATPASRRLVYEVHVTGLSTGPDPVLYAEVMVSVDGVNAFHGQGMAVRLVRDTPLEHWRDLGPHREQTTGVCLEPRLLGGLVGHREPRPVATEDGFAFGYPSLLACAWGRPGHAFGPWAAAMEQSATSIRLPGPPYHFMSRIVSLDAARADPRPGSAIVAEYDVPPEVWYFEQNGSAVMPWTALMEVVLQPCGWLAVRTADPSLADGPRSVFRNLDGTARLHRQVGPDARTLRTRVELTGSVRHGDITIVSFTVDCEADGMPLLTVTSSFGFFPQTALEHQAGLPPDSEERAQWAAPCETVADLTAERPGTGARLPGPMLRMLDRVTGYWPDGGPAGLGRLRAEKPVDPGAWYFKAHFFTDPVQSGSLGVEAMAQLLQYRLLDTAPAEDIAAGALQPLTDKEFTWRYRGQVVPTDGIVTVGIDVVEDGTDHQGRYALADGWLWVDGRRIYRVQRLGMRLIPASRPDA